MSATQRPMPKSVSVLILVLALAVIGLVVFLRSQMPSGPSGGAELHVDVDPLQDTQHGYLDTRYSHGARPLRMPDGHVLGISADGATLAFNAIRDFSGDSVGSGVVPRVHLIDVASGEERDVLAAERCGINFVADRLLCATAELDEHDNLIVGTHVITDIDVNTGQSRFAIPIDDWAVQQLRVIAHDPDRIIVQIEQAHPSHLLWAITHDGEKLWEADIVDGDCYVRGESVICSGWNPHAGRGEVVEVDLETGATEVLFGRDDVLSPYPTTDGLFYASLEDGAALLDRLGDVVGQDDVFLAGVTPSLRDVGYPSAAISRGRDEASGVRRAYLADGSNPVTGIFDSVARDGEDETSEYTWHHVDGREAVTLRAHAEAITADGQTMVFVSGYQTQQVHLIDMVTGQRLLTHDVGEISASFPDVTDGVFSASGIRQDVWVYLPGEG